MERGRLDRGQTDLLAPTIDVVGIASTISGEGDNRDVDLVTGVAGCSKACVAHDRSRRRRPVRGNFPFDLRLVGVRARFRLCRDRSPARAANRADPFNEIFFLSTDERRISAHLKKYSALFV